MVRTNLGPVNTSKPKKWTEKQDIRIKISEKEKMRMLMGGDSALVRADTDWPPPHSKHRLSSSPASVYLILIIIIINSIINIIVNSNITVIIDIIILIIIFPIEKAASFPLQPIL